MMFTENTIISLVYLSFEASSDSQMVDCRRKTTNIGYFC